MFEPYGRAGQRDVMAITKRRIAWRRQAVKLALAEGGLSGPAAADAAVAGHWQARAIGEPDSRGARSKLDLRRAVACATAHEASPQQGTHHRI